MVVFSTQSDYAVILLSELARSKTYLSISKVAKDKKLPYRYLSRIASTLKAAGLIQSKEGVTGGYLLNKQPDQIPLADVLALFEKIGTTRCTIHGDACPRQGECEYRGNWIKMREEILAVIAKYSLADFV